MKYTKAITACVSAIATLLVTFGVLTDDVGAAVIANLPTFLGSVTAVTASVWFLPNRS